ncbi:hypothetical protein N8836_00505 [Flavobacteriaceae bacterium]|jgi:hypothetical protein|nr:hypothetical protein [Flavobacteriaceae bacterium]MDA7724062.1 hypothetical protein [Flavobacteriaceae bacterium]MDA7727566.1 hypothetical protein [Flavobacteriaceae bacterium]MDG1309362.1 hypothetical protein [Flavobacteriaceae bacterium]
MKKKLESELISIAHRILKLTGREDLEKMHSEIALLYQKITVLKFIENNHDGETSDFVGMDTSFFNALEGAFNNTVTDSVEVADKTFVNIDVEEEEAIMEPAIEKIKDMVAQMPEETIEVDTIIDAMNEPTETVVHDLNELSPSYAQLPIFDAVSPEPPQTSLNDQLKTQGFQIGLNDRLAFVKNLFENSNEDYERVLSQLSTLDSHDEAMNLLDSIIKPDYNNWEGQEEIEARFLEIIENKFK